jgi:hypothetical protein
MENTAMIISYEIPTYNISEDIKHYETEYDLLHCRYEDLVDEYNNDFTNCLLEHINYIEEEILICEHNLYDSRQREFTNVEAYLYELVYLRDMINSQILIINHDSNMILQYMEHTGYEKEIVVSSLYYHNINCDNIEKLKEKLNIIYKYIKSYKMYLDQLSEILELFENIFNNQ